MIQQRSKCSVDGCEDMVSRYVESRELCDRHYVELFVPLSIVFHRDVPAWARDVFTSDRELRNLGVLWTMTMPHVTIHVFHRREAHTVTWANNWMLKYDPHPKEHAPPYYLRGWSHYANREIVIIVDDTETPDSVAWLLYHELAHIAVGHVPYIQSVFSQEDRLAGIGAYQIGDDHAHEAHAVEQFCNRVANAYVGGKYDRLWWRPRAEAQRAEELATQRRAAVTARDEARI